MGQCGSSCAWKFGSAKDDCKRIRSCHCKCDDTDVWLSKNWNESLGEFGKPFEEMTEEEQRDYFNRTEIMQSCYAKCNQEKGRIEPKEWLCSHYGVEGFYRNLPVSWQVVTDLVGCDRSGFVIPDTAENQVNEALEKAAETANQKNKIILFLIICIAVVAAIQLIILEE